ncbi:hypothetical protein V3C99_009215 [Haemonchus contortus]
MKTSNLRLRWYEPSALILRWEATWLGTARHLWASMPKSITSSSIGLHHTSWLERYDDRTTGSGGRLRRSMQTHCRLASGQSTRRV